MTVTLLALVIVVVSLAFGLAPRHLARRLTDTQLADMTGMASGLLLASALIVVVPEGFHTASEGASGDDVFAYEPALLGATVLLGFVVMLLLEGFGVGHDVHEEHHDHRQGHGHGHVHHPTSPTVLALGLSVHAAADGLAIGAAAAVGETAFSILVALAVLIHRIPAAFSLGVFMAHEKIEPGRAVRGIAAFVLATPVALLLSYLALQGADERLIAIALLFSAGTFVYVATVDTLPSIHNPETGRRSLRNVVLGIAVFCLIVLLANALAFWNTRTELMIIRDAAPTDFGRINDIYNWTIIDNHVSFNTEPFDMATRREWWDGRDVELTCLVAELDDLVIGVTYSSWYRPKLAYRSTVETTIVLDGDHLGRGVGTRLLGALLDRLVEQGLHLAVAIVALPNDASVRLHEKLGYRTIGVLHEAGYKYGRYWDTMLLERRLS